MKVNILNRGHFITKGGSPASLPDSLIDVDISLPLKKLTFTRHGAEVVRYDSENAISFDQYSDRLICYLREGKVKVLSFEVYGDAKQLYELKSLLVLRNRIAHYKSPLQREYSTKIQESLMVNKKQSINVKGFINLGVIFVCLNYLRMIFESTSDKQFLFIDNVI